MGGDGGRTLEVSIGGGGAAGAAHSGTAWAASATGAANRRERVRIRMCIGLTAHRDSLGKGLITDGESEDVNAVG